MMGNGANQNSSIDVTVMLGLDLLGNVGRVCSFALFASFAKGEQVLPGKLCKC